MKICLDAGHYGKYNQSPANKAYYESDMNWKLHLMQKEELERCGIDVLLTRANKEQDLPLEARGALAKGCDMFISDHANSAADPAVNYVVAMHMIDDGCDIDDKSVEMARILSKTVADVMDLPHQVWAKESSKDRDGNGYKDDYYGVLRGAHAVGTPGVIIEHGFYTNPATVEWLMDESNLKKLAQAEAKAICELLGVPYIPEEKKISMELTVLKKGMKGDNVKALQALLTGYGYKFENNGKVYGIDGSFGTATLNAVKKYQKDNGLAVDGSVGRKTWTKLLGL